MKTFAALAAASLMAAPAFAGGMAEPVQQPAPVAAPAPVLPASFDWTGWYAGGQLGMGHVKLDSGLSGASGALGGVHAGYLYDFGKWVAGGELAYDKTNIKFPAFSGKLDHIWRLEAKVGPKFGRTFVYGVLGAGSAKATVAGTSHTDSGYFGGIGVDYRLSQQWSVGAQVLTGRYKNFDGSGVTGKPTTGTIDVSYHF